MKIIIREAHIDDLETLLRFEQGVIEYERQFDPTLKLKNTQYYDIPFMIESSHIQLLVAEINGELVGSGYARIEDAKPYLQHNLYAYLGFMYVSEKHRGKGVNKLIFEELKDWILSRGIHEVRLDVYNQNESAIKAYEKVGFKRHLDNMRMSLK